MPGPWDKYAQPQQGAAPKLVPLAPPDPFKVRDQELQEEAAARAREDQQFQRQKFEREMAEKAKDPKTTEGQKLSAGYYARALRAHKGYGQGVGPRPVAAQVGINMLPDALQPIVDANTGSERRGADNYMEEFVRAKLRKESGATIPPDELAKEYRVYFPIAGDGPEDIERKRQLREQVIEGLKVSAGEEANNVGMVPIDMGGEALGPGKRLPPEKEQELIALVNSGATPEQIDAFLKQFGLRSPNAGKEQTSSALDYSKIDAPVQAQIDAKMQANGGAGAAGVMGAVDAATFGLSDEITAGGNAFVGALQGEGSLSDLYRQNIGVERGYRNQLQNQHSGAYLGGQLLGGLAIPVGAGASGVGQFAKIGAAQGGAYGFGSAEGNPIERLPGAAIGAGIGMGAGAALGYAAPHVGNALSKFARPVTQEAQAARPIIEAGQRRQVPVREYDVRPDKRIDRGVAMTSERGGPIIRAADDADREAMEAAIARDLGGDLTPGDRFKVGDMTQDVLSRSRKDKGDEAKKYYTAAEKLAGPTRLFPQRAIAKIDEQIAELEADGPKSNRELIAYLKDKRDDLSRDGGLSIQSLRRQRTNMRGEINARNLGMTDAERRIGMVLDAAAEDIGSGLTGRAQELFRKGDQIWAERSRFTRQIMERLVGPRDNPHSPEVTAARLESWLKSDFGRARRVVAEMTPDERMELAAASAANLGRDSKGNFSISLFLNHTSGKGKQSQMSPQSMRLIFGEDGMRAIADLRALASAKVAGASEINNSKTGNIVQRVGRGLRTLLLSGFGFATGGPVGAIAAPVVQAHFSKMGQERLARMLTNPDFTKWLRSTPESASPEVINRHFARLNAVAARNPVLAGDAKALQQALMESFTQRAAASESDQGRENNE